MNKKKQIEKEIINNIKKCKLIYAYCLIDGIDVGKYYKTSKTEAIYHVKNYFKESDYISDNELYHFDNIKERHQLDDENNIYIN